ncbi:MAG TPA: universal stress protein [Desulfosporosinus sp.]|nr:universal stress protein [Desulfosporosinus sp.]
MNGCKFNVLLYSEESKSAFYAFIYSAFLMMNMPNMHLTVVHLQESKGTFIGDNQNGLSSWPISPTSDWLKDVMGRADSATKTKDLELLTKANDVFSARALEVYHQVIYCNPNIPDSVDALLDYSRKKSIELIIMGTGELGTLKGLIFGSLAHTLQNKSSIPVLLVKNLSEDFLNSYGSRPILKLIHK